MKICHVVGARPNYMKAAPVIRALRRYSGAEQILVHTGQHYDFNMSDAFFQQLGMAAPDINLKVKDLAVTHNKLLILWSGLSPSSQLKNLTWCWSTEM